MIKRGTWAAAVACAALFAAAGCGGSDSGGGRRRRQAPRPTPASRCPRCRWRRASARARASSTSSPGPATPRTAPPTRRSTGSRRSRRQTGCQVNVKIGNTSDEMVTLMRTGQYDGVSASGDATLRLIAGGDVAPVNTNLVPNYADVFQQLKNQDFNSVNGQMYGIPHGRGANLLMWRSDKVPGALDSWSAVFDQGSQYKGSLTAYDNPIYIADAALYLKATKPDAEDHEPLRARRQPVQGRRSPCSRTSARTSASTGRTTPRSRPPSRAATRPSAPPGRSSPTCSTPTRSRSRRPCPRRARRGGRTRG